MKKALIIYNPNAGSEQGEKFQKILYKKLAQHFDEVESKGTTKPGDAIEFAKEASENNFHSIFAIGGDGTINEVVSGMIKANVEKTPILGVIPGGTFNGVSRILEFPQNPNNAIKNLDFDKTEFMDIGISNDKTFNMIYSIGDVPESLHSVSSKDKATFSVFAYAINIAKDVVKNSHNHMKVTVNDTVLEGDYSHLVVILSSALSKLALIDSDIKKNDGYLHLFLLKESSMFEKLGLLPNLIAGQLDKNEIIKYFKAKEIKIESNEKVLKTDLDGDVSDPVPSNLKIFPKAIELYTLDI